MEKNQARIMTGRFVVELILELISSMTIKVRAENLLMMRRTVVILTPTKVPPIIFELIG